MSMGRSGNGAQIARRRLDIVIGERFGKLLVQGIQPGKKNSARRAVCLCDCGNWSAPALRDILDGASRSCGCVPKYIRHGHAHHNGAINSPTYQTWRAMTGRCSRPTDPAFRYYGGRGIKVCERWSDFANFLADMGERPEGRTIDRIDVNGNYEPGNCRWATPLEQAHNKRPKSSGMLSVVDS